MAQNISKYTRPRYIESTASVPKYIGILLTPTLQRDDETFIVGNIDSQANFIEFYQSRDSGSTWSLLYTKPISEGSNITIYPANMENGNYSFKVRVGAQYSVPDEVEPGTQQTYHDETFYSPYSTEDISIVITQLEKPIIHNIVEHSEYYFDKDEHAAYIQVVIESETHFVEQFIYRDQTPTMASPLRLSYIIPGTFTITAINIFNGWTDNIYYKNSDTSEPQKYIVTKLNTPVIDLSAFDPETSTISWGVVSGAGSYQIYLNGDLIMDNYNGTSISLTAYLKPGILDYSAVVLALPPEQDVYANPLILNSDKSEPQIFGVLPTPVLDINDNIITIKNFSDFGNADEFEVYDQGVLWYKTNASNNEIVLESNVPRIFQIYIKAVSNQATISDSQISNTITYRILKLSMPVISGEKQGDNYIVNWTTINGADFYDIYLNSVLITNTSGTSYTISLNAGYNTIYIIARSYLYQYLDSNPSNTLSTSRSANTQYFARIEGVDYNIDLPFNISKTLDESMDSGFLTLEPISRKDPFEAYSSIEIHICAEEELYDENDNFLGYTYTDLNVEDYPLHMLVSEDDVEEILYYSSGNSDPKYKHHINVIERTKLLETELLPDFSITQPMEYTQKSVEVINDEVKPVYTNKYFNSQTVKQTVELDYLQIYYYNRFDLLLQKNFRGYGVIKGINNMDMMETPVYSVYRQGEVIALPNNNADSFIVAAYKKTFIGSIISYFLNGIFLDIPWVNSNILAWGNPSLIQGIISTIKKRYKYRAHSDDYNVNDNSPETVITEFYGLNTRPSFNTKYIQPGAYDIIFEMEISDRWWNIFMNYIKTVMGEDFAVNNIITTKPELMVDDEAIQAIKDAYSGGVQNWSNVVPAVNDAFKKTKKFRVVWPNIRIMKRKSGEFDPDINIGTKSTTIWEGLNKCIDIVKPLEDGVAPKYRIDNRLKGVLDAKKADGISSVYPCPELKFQNQKSLYETLLELGREFYGIPRLGCYQEDDNGIQYWDNYCITFDRLSTDVIEAINQDYENTDSLENVKSSIDNHTTGYISDISNMISDGQISSTYYQYPSGDIWMNPTSSSPDDVLATKDNMALTVDRPIYRLINVIVKNYDYRNPNAEFSLRNFIFEYTLYNSLNNNATGKGMALYYKKGDNQILGLGQLPEPELWQKIFGWNPDDYIISRILWNNGVGESINKLNERANQFQYKVIYIPYNDAKIYTEQKNIANLKYSTYKSFNQENNIITDTTFGKSTQTQIERLGNNSISKDFINNDILSLPKLGQIQVFNNQKYYADTIVYNFGNNYMSATVSFSKNFNKINERIGINSDYREYRIYNSDAVSRSININKYCYISTRDYDIETTTILPRLIQNIKDSFNNGTGVTAPKQYPDSLYVRPLQADGTSRLLYTDYTGNIQPVNTFIIPLTLNKFSNTFALSGQCIDNFSAGISSERIADIPGIAIIPTDNENVRIQSDVRYVDNNGNCPVLGLTFFKLDNNINRLIDVKDNGVTSWPKANYIQNPASLSGAIYAQKIKVNKDNKDALKFIYQLHFQTYDRALTIGTGISSRIFDNNSRTRTIGGKLSPVYYLFKGDISKQETIKNNVLQVVGTPSFTADNNKIIISSVNIAPNDNYAGFVLAWPDNGEIIFSYRRSVQAGEEYNIPAFYMNFADDKIEYEQD